MAERGGFDVAIGNPPYLNQLQSGTAVADEDRRLLTVRFGEVRQPYTDLATLFLVRSVDLLTVGGRCALVHPLSLFGAKDALPARRLLARSCEITAVWCTTDAIFPTATVRVCTVGLQKGPAVEADGALVPRWFGNALASAPPLHVEMGALVEASSWGELIADLLGVPAVELPGPGRLRDLAATTGDFRDQFYGLAPYVGEDGPETADWAPLIVTGLVDPAACRWGATSCRFAGTRYERPRVDVERLDGVLATWAQRRLVPKLIVATQTRVLEAFADPEGRFLNTVPTVTVLPHDPADLWRLLAVLLAPPVSAWALARYSGLALSTDALKLSASQVGDIPLPAGRAAWEAAADAIRAASVSASGRRGHLLAAGRLMCDAYEVSPEPVLSWWAGRLPLERAGMLDG